MQVPRWYARATQLGNDRVWVSGNSGDPEGIQEETRDIFDTSTGWQSTPATPMELFRNSPAEGCPTSSPYLELFGYPRLNLLSSGLLLHSDAATSGFPAGNLMSRFLDVEFKPGWSCPATPFFLPRWRGGTDPGEDTFPKSLHIDGSAVHLITWNSVTGTFTEVVYAVAGAKQEFADADGHCQVGSEAALIVKTVEKMTNPDHNQVWVDQGVPDLYETSVNHNTVILLDGSLLKVGGAAVEYDGSSSSCQYRKWPVRLRLPEVVESLGGQAVPWAWCHPQVAARQYHSTAGLLRDGRVFSAGGANALTDEFPDLSDHSVEIYKPPYFFQGPRPVIDATTLQDPYTGSPPNYDYNSDLIFQVTTGNAFVERVAIIRTGSVTHAFDAGQFYVELERVELPVAVGPGKWQVHYRMPPNGNWAPPGFYYLTVADNNELPSVAEWIRVGNL